MDSTSMYVKWKAKAGKNDIIMVHGTCALCYVHTYFAAKLLVK